MREKGANHRRAGAALMALAGAVAIAVPASAGASTGSTGLAHAVGVVGYYSKPVTKYNLPTSPIKDVAKLKGKKVMFIPLVDQIPAFQLVRGAFTAALGKAGISVTDCSGQANPSGVQACINQAESGGYAGIVTAAIPYEIAANAFQSAEAKHIPVLITDQLAEPKYQKNDVLVYQPGNAAEPTLMADWIIADSKGKANAIVTVETDSPSSTAYVTQGELPEFKKYCPGCKVVPVDTPSTGVTGQWVETQIHKDPGAQYFYSEFEDDLAPVTQGVSLSGKASTLKVGYATATIAGLSYMKQGKQVFADVGDDVAYEGWADADNILRMMSSQPTVTEHIPERLFTRQNINSISLTNAAQASGVWYGNPMLFQTGFEKLWGVK